MAEVQFKLSALKASELSTMLGRSLMSKYKADFFLTFTRSSTYLYTYDEAINEVRLLFKLEATFFDLYQVGRTATIKVEEVKDLYQIIEKNSYKVTAADKTQQLWINASLDETFVEENANDRELKIVNIYESFEVAQVYSLLIQCPLYRGRTTTCDRDVHSEEGRAEQDHAFQVRD